MAVSGEASSHSIDHLRLEAVALHEAWGEWQASQPDDCRPCTVGNCADKSPGSRIKVGHWPSKIDTYVDLYIASVWNISRAARLLLADICASLPLNESNDVKVIPDNEISQDIEGLIASIPFHLAEDVQVFLRDLEKTPPTSIAAPGRVAGGLLLMHPLAAVARLSIVPIGIREYLTDCLEWTALNMGIGQASFLAKVSDYRRA